VMGHGWFYYLTIASVLLALTLSANTAFADFPRLTRAIAHNDYMPHVFLLRVRRLLYSWGIYVLVALTAILLIIFRGVTDRLIPLYAVGAFMAFTLSQAGMVAHWKMVCGAGAHRNMLLNGLGAVATAITLSVVLIAKFTEGSWITVVLIPAMILTMTAVKRHYRAVEKQTWTDTPVNTQDLRAPIVLIPMDRWSVVSEKALRFAWGLSTQIQILHVECGEETESLCRNW